MDYSKILNPKVVELAPSGIRKYFDIAASMKDVISLGVGEPDFPTPWHIRQSGIEAIQSKKTRYTSNWGLIELRNEVADYMKRRFSLEYSGKSEVIISVGGSEAIDLCFRSLITPGDEVLIPEPSFVCYSPIATLAGGKAVPIALSPDNGFRLTAEQLKNALTDKTKLLVLPFPNNPTGSVLRMEDLEEIAAVIRETNICILSDEIYAELTYNGKHISIAEIDGMRERTVIASGFSKAYAMTGWRIGFIAAAEWIVKGCNKLQGQYTSGPCSVSQKAAEAAYTGTQAPVEEMRQAFERRRDLIVRLAKEIPGLEVNCPQGAFYLFPKCSSFFGKRCGDRVINTSTDLAMYLLEVGHVATVGGDDFGSPECFRMSYATSDENIIEAMRRMKEALAKLV